MSQQQENLEVIQRDWVDALREGDVERAVARLAPGIAWQGVESHLVCRDRDAVVGWLRGFTERGQPQVERLELTPAPGGVVLSVVGPDFRETGDVPLDGQLHILFRLRDGRITHMHDYRRLEEALAAAESPPPSVQPRETVADLGPAAPERARAVGFVPFLHVADVARSAGFYRLLGFEARETYAPSVRLEWALLEHMEGRLMLARGERIDPRRQGVLFYLYSHDLAGLRRHLLAHGVAAGEIVDGTPGPRQEMRLEDPDGYVLMVAQIEDPAEP